MNTVPHGRGMIRRLSAAPTQEPLLSLRHRLQGMTKGEKALLSR
jgi:hypothetical protein